MKKFIVFSEFKNDKCSQSSKNMKKFDFTFNPIQPNKKNNHRTMAFLSYDIMEQVGREVENVRETVTAANKKKFGVVVASLNRINREIDASTRPEVDASTFIKSAIKEHMIIATFFLDYGEPPREQRGRRAARVSRGRKAFNSWRYMK